MKKGKYASNRSAKPVALLLALVLVLGIAIGGTIAWLTASTGTVTNTFTTSDIKINLTENTGDSYQMIPGHTIAKDPFATVTADSENCYLFVTIEEDLNVWADNVLANGTPATFKDYLNYAVAADWEILKDDDDNVIAYYKVIDAADEKGTTKHYVLEGNSVYVQPIVTKAMMNEIVDNDDMPTLSFKAFACQLMKDNTTPFTPAEAWNNVKPTT